MEFSNPGALGGDDAQGVRCPKITVFKERLSVKNFLLAFSVFAKNYQKFLIILRNSFQKSLKSLLGLIKI